MAGWLTTAANVFRKRTESPPESFEVRCVCGRTVAGVRSRLPQTPACPGCRLPLFVLPACVYPPVKSPPKKQAARTRPPTSENGNLPGAGNSPAGSGRKPGTKDRSPGTKNRGKELTAAEHARESLADRLRQATSRDSLRAWRRKNLTPLRVVVLGIVAVIAVTFWWMNHLRTQERAREVLTIAPRLGEEALQEGDLATAAQQFQRVRQAVDVLGRDDPQSHRWRQQARETLAISELASASLHDILQEAAEMSAGRSAESWAEYFRTTYRNGWVLFDALVTRTADESGPERYLIDYPLVMGENRGELVGNLVAFRALFDTPGEPRRVIFAAQLAGCRLAPDADGTWQIELAAESAFLWSSAETYALPGLTVDEATKKVLAEQAQLLGIEP